MKTKMAGVALAAVMACGGLAWSATSAGAAIISISTSNANDDSIGAILTFNPVSLAGEFYVRYDHYNGVGFDPPVEYDDFITVSRSVYDGGIGANFYDVTLNASGGFGDLQIVVGQSKIDQSTYIEYATLRGEGVFEASIEGSVLPTVPLPSTLALFGTTLFGLGGISVVRRRHLFRQAAIG